MTKAKIFGSGLVLIAAFGMAAEAKTPETKAPAAKLYKWVDDNGETHYGEVVPPEYANKEKVQLNSSGREVKDKQKENEAASVKNGAENQAAIDQRRKDNALTNTYSNEKEIDLARDRNLQQVEARINSAELRLKSAKANLEEHRKESDNFSARGKNVPYSLQEDLADDEAKVAKLQQELARGQQEATTVKERYEADKIRYRELTGGAGK
jgi:hypothetical protein